MDAILNCRLEEMEDYYSLLGCDELSTVEQIAAEFKVRARECHPDKHPANPQAVEKFQQLQQAKEILTNEDSRVRYDYWRRSKIAIPFQQWEALSNSIKTSMHWAVKGKKEPMLEAPGLPLNDKKAGDFSQKEEHNHGELLDDKKELEGFAPSDDISPKSPDTPGFSDLNCWHLRFRWSGETPSELLRKFRNYEI
ncbi:dnaJ homolog subfamily C member 12 [Anolis carolinensis]|uniref:DnaJ homolog subfamily C member 12 n=1 Tax=Anolis carolinensis TaxID=28377 RepID=A0A803T0J9_ANOCA|nr:PREDICTED: dnaJ homolog subfamily C member 12 [Anolis carolinensis]|eukprot:XP_003223726.1 PREDICTED: dnaJ homolog subfamily C member 12 [Anolis carolinensis]